MKAGAALHLTDGKGHLIKAVITNDHKKHCEVAVQDVSWSARPEPSVIIAIAPTKNSSRMEWLLEKAAEMGVQEVIPLLTRRTERQRFKAERMRNILISAMLQSQQTWLLHMPAAMDFDKLMVDAKYETVPNKYMAHCVETDKQALSRSSTSSIILIGPEGDFTTEEIRAALEKGYQPVTLGETRLRTETAGMVAAALLKIG